MFEPPEIQEGIAFRQSIPLDLMALLRRWAQGFVPLNGIESSLSELIDVRDAHPVERVAGAVTAQDLIATAEPGDVAHRLHWKQVAATRSPGRPMASRTRSTSCSSTRSWSRSCTARPTTCNEYCKYYKNVENAHYKFIPMVHRVSNDGTLSHVTGIVTISPEEFEAMPKRFDGEWLRDSFPEVAQSMDRFIDKVKRETNGEVVGDLEIIRIPLNLYRARNATNLACAGSDHPFATTPVFLVGDSAIGSPYFQSISLGFECAMFLAGLIDAGRPGGRRDARSLRALHLQAVAARVHPEQDDQEQQGPVPVAR